MKESNIRKSINMAAAIIFLSGGIFSVKADPVLFVSPTRVNLDESHKVEVMNLSNLSDATRHYKINIEEYSMDATGHTVLKENFPYSAKKMLRYYPRDVTIKPGERQAVRVMAKIPADTPDGQYHAHISFLEDGMSDTSSDNMAEAKPNQSSMHVAIAYATVMPITVTRGQVDTKVGWLKDGSISWNEKDKQYVAKFTLTRSGNGQGAAYVDVIYVPTNGQPSQIGNRRTFYIYRELDKRLAELPFELPKDGSGGQIKLRLLTGDPTKQEPPTLVDEMLLPIP